jgi:hypothetical protein
MDASREPPARHRGRLPASFAGSPLATKLVVGLSIVFLTQLVGQELAAMWTTRPSRLLFSLMSAGGGVAQTVDLSWHAPASTQINNLTSVLSSTGVYGFIYNSSQTPDSEYGTYNWCNMPHVRKTEYVTASSEYELAYVEVVSDCLDSPCDGDCEDDA